MGHNFLGDIKKKHFTMGISIFFKVSLYKHKIQYVMYVCMLTMMMCKGFLTDHFQVAAKSHSGIIINTINKKITVNVYWLNL